MATVLPDAPMVELFLWGANGIEDDVPAHWIARATVYDDVVAYAPVSGGGVLGTYTCTCSLTEYRVLTEKEASKVDKTLLYNPRATQTDLMRVIGVTP